MCLDDIASVSTITPREHHRQQPAALLRSSAAGTSAKDATRSTPSGFSKKLTSSALKSIPSTAAAGPSAASCASVASTISPTPSVRRAAANVTSKAASVKSSSPPASRQQKPAVAATAEQHTAIASAVAQSTTADAAVAMPLSTPARPSFVEGVVDLETLLPYESVKASFAVDVTKLMSAMKKAIRVSSAYIDRALHLEHELDRVKADRDTLEIALRLSRAAAAWSPSSYESAGVNRLVDELRFGYDQRMATLMAQTREATNYSRGAKSRIMALQAALQQERQATLVAEARCQQFRDQMCDVLSRSMSDLCTSNRILNAERASFLSPV